MLRSLDRGSVERVDDALRDLGQCDPKVAVAAKKVSVELLVKFSARLVEKSFSERGFHDLNSRISVILEFHRFASSQSP